MQFLEVLEGKEAEFGMGRGDKTTGEEREKLGQRVGWTRNRGIRQEKATLGSNPGKEITGNLLVLQPVGLLI